MRLVDLDILTQASSVEQTRYFTESTQGVSLLYLMCLGKFETNGVRKISVTLQEGAQFSLGQVLHDNYNHVMLVDCQYPLSGYWNSPDHEKKVTVLRVIDNVMRDLCSRYSWDQAACEAAYRCCMGRNLETRYSLLKPLASPDRKLSGEVVVEIEPEVARVWMLFCAQGDAAEISRHLVKEISPTMLRFIGRKLRLKWVDNSTVRLEGALRGVFSTEQVPK